jgi:hypothetical protein
MSAKEEKLPESTIAFLGIALGARGIEAAREYVASLGEGDPYSQFDCLNHVVERLGIHGADLDRLISGMQGREIELAETARDLERRGNEVNRINERLGQLDGRMTEIIDEVRRIEDERRRLMDELRSLAPDYEIPG